jgi:putative ABC transport system ATP-binding protein
MSVIKTTNLNKIYDKKCVPVQALKSVDLKIEEGEFTAIVGPSGSGKTTLLNILGALDTPSSGSVEIGGVNMASLTPQQLTQFRLQNIGFVFQAYNLIPVFTVEENVRFILELQNWPVKKRNERVQDLLSAVGLTDKIKSRPSQLSGGQQQRVAVARALASKPKFILADEPTANLDSASTENLLSMMADMNSKEKITFIFSTHDSRVMKKARRLITVADGKIVDDKIQA